MMSPVLGSEICSLSNSGYSCTGEKSSYTRFSSAGHDVEVSFSQPGSGKSSLVKKYIKLFFLGCPALYGMPCPTALLGVTTERFSVL